MRRAMAARPLAPSDLAWLLLLPAVAIAVPLVALLARPLGHLAFAAPPFHYWAPELIVRKASVQAGYLLTVGCACAYAAAIVLARGGERLARLRGRRAIVAVSQLLTVALLVLCWIEQRHVRPAGQTWLFFTRTTILVAAGLALATVAVARFAPRPVLRVGRPERAACFLAALALTAAWLAPAVATDSSIGFAPGEVVYLARFAFDEATSVLNGRSPLVDMASYATLWPYVTALPLWLANGSYAAFSLLMSAISAAGLLAIYAVLRRVAGRPLAALALYAPFLATSLFVKGLMFTAYGEVRYFPGDYFGVFPLRYAGPYLLAWLTARQLDAPVQRQRSLALLFAAATLVALDNLDFGVPALAATLAALLCARRPPLGVLARAVGAGALAALALVTALTLVRAGSLPQLGLLLRYGRTFSLGGYSNLALPGLGLHLVVTATFVAALAVAAVRTRAQAPAHTLTGMLAWSGLFGLGASVYYYAYRSHPIVLIDLFSMWTFALALLVIVVLRDERLRRGWPALPQLAVLLGFGLAVCSLAQRPHPHQDLRRIAADAGTRPMFLPQLLATVASATRPGERVAILDALGHRIAREAGVVDVAPYTGLEQMATGEQMDDVVTLLAHEGGRRVFVPTTVPGIPPTIVRGARATLAQHGFRVARRWAEGVELVAPRR